ncbi:MAG: WD40/YVTN/BNR-like repeat-containing protein [Bacteroidota bacterium]
MNKKWTLYLLLLLPAGLMAQTIDLKKHFSNWKPRNIGPAGMSGRVTAIDAVWSNPNIVYLGTASGGVWKTENSGGSWTPIFDEQPIQNIGAVAITQNNPNIVWVGTGEGNPRNSVSLGEGIYKSLDGGKTWKCMGLQKTRNIHRILIDPQQPDVVYVGVMGNPFAAHPERGLYKTTDGGETWKLILHTNDTSGVGDMVMDPTNPQKLLVNMYQHIRTPWSLKGGGSGSGLYVTYDGGKNFKKLGKEEGLPAGDLGRIGIAIGRNDPNRIYALVEATKNGLYRSDDGGNKWELVNSDPSVVTNRAFYFQDIAVDPQNENRLYNINQMIGMSEDGGKTFKTIIPYSGIHPDHHAWWIHPTNPSLIIDGNDGGIGISRDRGKTWQFDEKLPLGQFYHINTDNQIPYNVMGGLQDNGSWHGPAYVWVRSGIRNAYWQGVGGGDGFDVSADPANPNWVYSMSQGGALSRYNIATGEDWSIRPPRPNLSTRHRFNWNAALAQDPFDKGTIYYGSQFLNKSTDRGASWEVISPDLTSNDSAKIDQSNNGGISIDITGAENYCTILTIAPSPIQKDVIWVGTDDGIVQLTTDGGKTWTSFRNKIPGLPAGAWIPQIRASRHIAGEAFVVANDYRRGSNAVLLFRTNDFGKTWTRMADEKKLTGYVLCMIQDPVEPNLIFVGTEQGLWVSMDNGNQFQQFKNGYPSVSTYDLDIQEREADLVIGTFGRAIWILDDIRPLRKLAANKGQLPGTPLTAFQPPTSYQANIKNASGIEYSTWGTYEGENRRTGAPISFFVNKAGRDTGKNKLPDTAQIKIYDANQQAVRTLKAKADSGFNRFYWGMEGKGIRQPAMGGRGGGGRMGGRGGNDEPGGLPVDPGTYKVVISLGKGIADSCMITVQDDPKAPLDPNVRKAIREANKELDQSTLKLVDLVDRISEADEIIKKVEASYKDMEPSKTDTLKKATKAMQDSIKAMRETLSGKPQEKQGYGNVPQTTVNSLLGEARMTVMGKNAIPGAQERRLMQDAANAVNNVVQRANTFFEGPWKNYQSLVESVPVKWFKEYKPLQ